MEDTDVEEGFDAGPWNNVVNCSVCGQPCEWVAGLDPDCDMPNGISGWFCYICSVFTDIDASSRS